MKQISFCITCMNRLKHLQETLEKNILDKVSSINSIYPLVSDSRTL